MHFDLFVSDDSVASYDVHRKTTFFWSASGDSLSLAQSSIYCNGNLGEYCLNVALLYGNWLNKLTLSASPKKILKNIPFFHRINLTPLKRQGKSNCPLQAPIAAILKKNSFLVQYLYNKVLWTNFWFCLSFNYKNCQKYVYLDWCDPLEYFQLLKLKIQFCLRIYSSWILENIDKEWKNKINEEVSLSVELQKLR